MNASHCTEAVGHRASGCTPFWGLGYKFSGLQMSDNLSRLKNSLNAEGKRGLFSQRAKAWDFRELCSQAKGAKMIDQRGTLRVGLRVVEREKRG